MSFQCESDCCRCECEDFASNKAYKNFRVSDNNLYLGSTTSQGKVPKVEQIIQHCHVIEGGKLLGRRSIDDQLIITRKC